jgi:hypothetical protein
MDFSGPYYHVSGMYPSQNSSLRTYTSMLGGYYMDEYYYGGTVIQLVNTGDISAPDTTQVTHYEQVLGNCPYDQWRKK